MLAERKKAHKTAVLKARSRRIKELLHEIQPDILHAIFLYQRGWSASYTGFHPLVISLLGSDIYLPRGQYRNGFQYFRDRLFNANALRQADLITAVSNDLCQAANQLTMNFVPVELVPIGTNLERFKPDLDTTQLRQTLEIPEDSFVILSPRQMTPLYNQDVILHSVPKVLEALPNAVFIMKDSFCDTDERKNYVQSLKDLAKNLGISHAIRWVGEVPLEELPLYFVLADVILSVPSTDGMPVTLFEAMACQKPLIVGDLPSYNEVITQGQTGLRVPVRNSQALAQAIIRIANNPDLVTHMIEESQLVLQQYGIFEQQMLRMERYYQRLAHEQPRWTNTMRMKFDRLIYKALINLT